MAADGRDRYFGGRPGEAEKARRRLHAKHGVAKGEQAFQAELARRRVNYGQRGRGVALERRVRDEDQ